MNQKNTTQTVLIVLDGWGFREEGENNAIAKAKTPFFDHLWQDYSHALIDASGDAVGLPEGQMGNSEVGHMTIGAGKIIDTDLVRISKSFRDKTFQDISVIQELFAHIKKYNSTLHIQGLISSGGIHSHDYHLHEFLKLAKEQGITKIAIHAFTDGRDTPPQSAHEYLQTLENLLDELGIGFIATATGRFYAMDRDKNWDRVEKAEKALFECEGNICTPKKPSEVIKELYASNIIDEMLEPVVFLDNNGQSYKISDNDAVFFFNFRSDRAKQLSQRIIEKTKDMNVYFTTITDYGSDVNSLIVFPNVDINTTLAKEVSEAGLTQAHIAETEKFAHATYFLNCGDEKTHVGEEFVMVESRKDIKTHDEAPKMRAKEIADKAIEFIEKGTDFLFINFANADMVGHTANEEAIIIAIEEVDIQLKRVIETLESRGGRALITADHGNAETNIDETGTKHTAHTTNFVPAIIVDQQKYTMQNGTLADIAPTVLTLIGLTIPTEMTGKVLI